jgi:WD40 repeat protein
MTDGGLSLPYALTIPSHSTAFDEKGSITPGPSLTGNAYTGASAIHRPDGRILIIHGSGQSTTSIFDPLTSTTTAGPALTANAYFGSHSFQRPDGKYVVYLGNTTAVTNIYDPVANTFVAGPSLATGNIYDGAHTIQLPNGKFLTFNGNASSATNIYDPVTNTFTAGPTMTTAVGPGAFSIKRPDGKFLVVVGNTNSSTALYDPTTNSFVTGPSVGASVGEGALAIQRPDGTWLVMIGGSSGSSYIYDPRSNTFTPGASTIAIAIGSSVVQMPDGRFTIVPGAGGANTRIYDPIANTFPVSGVSFPSANPNRGGVSIPLPNGKFLIVSGGNIPNTHIYDPGWNTRGYYESEFINDTTLDSNSTFVWKGNADAYKSGVVSVRVRTATSADTLQTAAWRTLPVSGSRISPSASEVWMQVRIEMNRPVTTVTQPGALKNVSVSESGNVLYNRLPLLGSAGYTNQAEVFVKPTIYSYAIQKQEGQDLATFQVNGNSVFRFSATGDAYTSAGGSWNAGGADVAEYFPTEDGLLEPGDIVSVSSTPDGLVRMTTESYDEQILGIVTTAPGLRLGSDDIGANQGKQPIALAGRVPVKVSLENGVIKKGDYLTSSSRPGFAMKALDAGRVIGIALEDYTLEMDTQNNGAGKVLTFVNPFKDTAGPSLHVLIKLLATLTLVLAALFV